MPSVESVLAERLQPGMRVVMADGAGAPLALLGPLSEVARAVGGIELVLGWCLVPPSDLDPSAFARVSTVMGGFGLRDLVRSGAVDYLPEPLRDIPGLLRTTLTPDLMILGVSPSDSGWRWGTEVSWMASVIESGVRVLGVASELLPATSAEPPLPAERIDTVVEHTYEPAPLPTPRPDPVARAIGRHVAARVPEGACLQVGPGPVGASILEALDVPVRLRTGMVTDAVIELDRRGLLLDRPWGAYVAGTAPLYDWAADAAVTRRVEETHAPVAADGRPWVTVNAALEIDLTGAVNVESIGNRHVSGRGGHSDFARLGHASAGGASIIAMPSRRRDAPTLVERLSGPVATPASDVDVVITEHGAADLRGLGDAARAEALTDLWSRG